MAYVIAEIGVNHNGDSGIAHKMIPVAKQVGADAVKFQCFTAEKLEPKGKRRKLLKKLELPKEEFASLKLHADSEGLDTIFTPFDQDWLRYVLGPMGCGVVKIGSADLNNEFLVDEAARLARRVLLSTGMASLLDIKRAVKHYGNIVVMHCTSSYPCPLEDVNLRAIHSLMGAFGEVGFSDHTTSTVVPALAVALGAIVVEKHFTLDKSMAGPDHRASLDPEEFREMVYNIRRTETVLGDGVKRVMPSESLVVGVRDERAKWRKEQDGIVC